MNSWGEAASYPRRTFYPLSDGPSIQNHRITMTSFRTCSTCQSRSQARLCHCTFEHDFRPCQAYLRTPPLRFGRRPPQSNCLPCTVPGPDDEPRLEPQTHQGGISTSAPPDLATRLQSLPPILHRSVQSSIQSYSKGSWGLSVFPRGDCIITNISTLLCFWWCLCGLRFVFRVGRFFFVL